MAMSRAAISGSTAVIRGLRTCSTRATAARGDVLTKTKDLAVLHDKQNKEFYIDLDGEFAVLQYDILDYESVDLYHTEVPERFRGKGIAKVLAKTALNHFVDNNKKMKLTCWYLQKYYEENPSRYQGKIIE